MNREENEISIGLETTPDMNKFRANMKLITTCMEDMSKEFAKAKEEYLKRYRYALKPSWFGGYTQKLKYKNDAECLLDEVDGLGKIERYDSLEEKLATKGFLRHEVREAVDRYGNGKMLFFSEIMKISQALDAIEPFTSPQLQLGQRTVKAYYFWLEKAKSHKRPIRYSDDV